MDIVILTKGSTLTFISNFDKISNINWDETICKGYAQQYFEDL